MSLISVNLVSRNHTSSKGGIHMKPGKICRNPTAPLAEEQDTTFTDMPPPPPASEGNVYTNQLTISDLMSPATPAHHHHPPNNMLLKAPVFPAAITTGRSQHNGPDPTHAQSVKPPTSAAHASAVRAAQHPPHVGYEIDTSGILYKV